ncbi:tetratricopeptide repeat protein [Dysgonomonas sp. 520]|uniref:type IX secretion system periplasmic lipoprotein PorW/SprE n=1 Tax=Dysgonomonas sp. 520 TaxID=2302931 RepID=UPI0013D2F1AC|nr:tetratricopeptide repeat protein [Dysgonomonas sp. 520]
MIATILFGSCSSQKNTSTTRAYHSINTRYNIYFNAYEAYKDALKSKNLSNKDNLSEIISIYPYDPEWDESKKGGGSFTTTIDKATKAIKLHSITTKPEKDPDKSKDTKYQEWLKSREFNPFLKNAWLLMGKAEYQNEDYLKAITTFAHISHLYNNNLEVITEARLWMALSYTQMGWQYEADNMFQKVKPEGMSEKLKGEFAGIYANYLVRMKQYDEAIPYIEEAIKSESDNYQKIRLRYLLGQIYAKKGERAKAYKAFGSVQGMRTPYEFSFNAKIRQAELYDSGNKSKVISSLTKMGKNSKNKEYLDQVYYTLGNVYLNEKDTVKAIDNYKIAIEKSTRNGYDKAIAQLQLGEIYFTQREFIKAQPCYSEAIGVLSKKHEKYPLASLRSAVLDELVVHAEAVHLQDSLQHLAGLPENERLAVIEKHIKDLKEQEAEQKRQEELLAKEEETKGQFVQQNQQTGWPNQQESSFYFDNRQTVEQGKISFKRLWGTRTLEDNWRRQNKQANVFAEDVPGGLDTDSLAQTGEGVEGMPTQNETIDDKYNPEYYLQQLPLTPEAIEASDKIIENALFNMGKIYKDKLTDFDLAVDAFNTDLTRFPATPNKEEIYYQLFLIYLQLGDKAMQEQYRAMLMREFPENDYAATLSDPNYEWNMLNMTLLQDSIYDATYNAYLDSKINAVRNNYQSIKEKYPLAKLMPKFMLLNALTYAQTNDEMKFKDNLQELVDTYPQSDVSEYASGILKNLLSGRRLASDNSPTRGMIWDLRFSDEEMAMHPDSIQFVDNRDANHLLLFIYNSKTVDRNQLIYDVAQYNFSSYNRRVFDLDFSEVGQIRLLQAKGYKSYDDIKSYMTKAFASESLISRIDPTVIPVPISVENMATLMRGKSLGEYFEFFKTNYSSDMRTLIAYWDNQIDLEIRKQEEEKALEEAQAEQQKQEEEKAKEMPVTELPVEAAPDKPVKVKPDDPVVKTDDKPEEGKEADQQPDKVEASAADLFTDEQADKIEGVVNTATEIINNPVDGLKNLFSKKRGQSKLTKEEQEEQKREKEEQKQLDKIRKETLKAQQDSVKRAEKAVQDSIRNAEKQAADILKQAERQKKEEQRLLEKQEKEQVEAEKKAKEEARKQKERDKKEREKNRREELKRKEKERNEKLKQREKERREKLRQREKERQERAKAKQKR